MPYTRRHWQDAPSTATRITAGALNNIEDGVEEALSGVGGLGTLPGEVAAVAVVAEGAATVAGAAAGELSGRLSEANLNNTIVSLSRGQEDVRKRIISRVPAAPKVMASPPTVTLSAGNAATSISGGILRTPKRTTPTGADGAPVDLVNDPLFTYLGTAAGTAAYGTGFPDYQFAAWTTPLTGVPTTQIGTWQPAIGFQHTGSVFEFVFKGLVNPNFYRIMVDGEYATADMQSLTISNTGQVFRLIVTFATTATRDIIVEFDQLRFAGVVLEPTASIVRLPPQPIRVTGIGDSFFGGAAELRRRASVLNYAATALGATEIWNLGVGGTGFINNGGNGQPFSARIATDLPQTDPTLIIVAGGFNDRSYTQAEVQAAATTALQNVVAAKPDALVFAVGCWSVGTPTTAEAQANAGVKAAAAAVGIPFIDVQDTAGIYASAPTYSAAQTYRPGDVVIYNGALYTAVAQSTAVAFTLANWRGLSVVNGTGKVGATTSNGNADIATQSDGVHPTVVGGRLLGAFIARRIYEICRDDLQP